MQHANLDNTGASQGDFKSYATGFILSVVLTVIAFGIIMSGAVSHPVALTCIFAAAVAQILVHLHYFLHLNRSSEARWNILAMLFTVLIIFIFVGGSLWIMYSLNYRMM